MKSVLAYRAPVAGSVGRGQVLDIPVFLHNVGQTCLLACALMIASYWRVTRPSLQWSPKVPPGPADPKWKAFWEGVYERMVGERVFGVEYSLRALQSDIDRLRAEEGLPIRLREVKDEPRGLPELSRFLVSRIPPIVIIDAERYYHNQRSIAGHSVIVRGVQGTSVITADPSNRVDLPYDASLFAKAWGAKSYETTLVVPVGTRVEEDKVQTSLGDWYGHGR